MAAPVFMFAGQGRDGERREAPPEPQVVRELQEKRTANARHYLLDDGKVRAEITAAPNSFKDANGRWQPLDPAFQARMGAFVGTGSTLHVETTEYGLRFAHQDHPDFQVEASTLELRQGSLVLTEASPWRAAGKSTLNRGRHHREELRLEGHRLLRDYVLAAPPAGQGNVVLSTELTLPQGWSVSMDDPDRVDDQGPALPVIVDDRGRPQFHMLPPLARDALAGEEPIPGELNQGFHQGRVNLVSLDNGRWRIEITFDETWLKSSERTYPVRLDPSFSGNGDWGGFIFYNTGTASWTVYQGTPYNWIYLTGNYSSTGNATGGYMQFDLSSIAPNATVTEARIQPYLVSAVTSTWVYAYDAAGPAPYSASSAAWNDLRGGEFFSIWFVNDGWTNQLLTEGGNATLAREVQTRVPNGSMVVGFYSDGGGSSDSTLRRLDSGLSQLNVTYDPGPLYQLAITEVHTGVPDWIEIYNYGPDMNLSGLELVTNDGALENYIFPSFTLRRHTSVVVHESTGTDTATDLYTGLSWGWVANNSGEVGLRTSSDWGIDYVKWGSPSAVGVETNQHWLSSAIPADFSDVIRRIHDDDTDQLEDWTIGGTATQGTINDGLLGNRRHSHLVINELSTSPDAIEIINLAPVYQRMTGWQLDTYTNNSLDGTGYTFPNFFYIPSGGRVRVSENGSKSNDSLTEVFTEYNIGWTTSTEGEAILYKTGLHQNAGGDYVAFNDPQTLHWASGTSWHGIDLEDGFNGWYRTDHMDTDSSFDFAGTSSFTWSQLNPGQLDPGLVQSDEVGTSYSGWNVTNGSYGNRFLATEDSIIWGFKQELILNETQDVIMYVLEDSGAGFVTAWQTTLAAMPQGGHVVSSGQINIPMQSGNTYLFITNPQGNAILTRGPNNGATMEYVHFGTFLGRSNSSSGITNLNHSTTSYAPHQWIETTPGANLPALEIFTTALPDGTNGVAYDQWLLGSGGGGGHTWTITAGSLPAGLTLSTGGQISGTPSGSGLSTFTVTLADNFGNSTNRSYSIYIDGPGDVRLLTDWLPDGLVGREYPDVALQAQGGNGTYTWWISAGSLPPGLLLDGAGNLSGTPTTAGDYQFTVSVQDGLNVQATPRVFDVSITEIPNQNGWVRRGLNGGDLNLLAVSPNLETDGTMFVAGPGPHFYFSDNRGNKWENLNFSLFSPVEEWLDLVVSPVYDGNGSNGTAAKTLFAVLKSGGINFLVRSTDGGLTWTDITVDNVDDLGSIKISPDFANDNTLIVKAEGRYEGYISTDQGNNWGSLNSNNLMDVEFSPDFANDATLYAFSNKADGIVVSTDLGGEWNPINLVGSTASHNVVMSPNFATDRTLWVYGEKIVRMADGGFSPHTWFDNGRSIKNLILQPGYDETDPNNRTMFAIMEEADGITWRLYRSENGGLSWTPTSNQAPSGHPEFDEGTGSFSFNTVVDPPVVISPQWDTDDSLFHVGKGFWSSSDSGITWFEDSDGIAQQRYQKVVYSPRFAQDDTFWVISEDGLLFKTGNQGQSLTRVSIPHNVNPAYEELDVYDVAMSPTYDAVNGIPGDDVDMTLAVYVAASGGVYMSLDGGFSWNPLSNRDPLAGELGARIVRLSPLFDQDETVVTANSTYLRRSIDGGKNWTRVEPGVSIEGYFDFEFSPSFNTNDTTVVVSIKYEGGAMYPAGGHSYISRDFRDDPPTWTRLNYSDGFNVAGDIQFSNSYLDDGTTGTAGTTYTFWVGDYFTTDNAGRFSIRPVGPMSPNYHDDLWFLRTSGTPTQVDYSDDSGASWALFSSDSLLNDVEMLGGPFLSPDYNRGNGFVAFAMEGHLLLSNDGGLSYWVVMGGDSISEDVRAVDTDPNAPTIIYAATGDKGLFKSLDKGLSFHQLLNGLPSVNQEFEDIRAYDSSIILAAHAVDGAYRSTDAGLTWNQMADTTGHLMEFAIGGGTIWAARSDGRSVKSIDSGVSWVELDPAILDMVDISYRGDLEPINSTSLGPNTFYASQEDHALKSASVSGKGGPSPYGLTAPTWGISKTSGPVATDDGGTTFTSATGAGGPFPLPTGVNYLTVLALQGDDLQVMVGTEGQGLWKTWDGGDTWHPMTQGLESTSQNMAELYQTSTGDILVGITGSTDGGVYLSADGGVSWMEINEGFDPDELSVQDLVNDSSEDGVISYWSGKDADGIWTRTIDVLPDPTLSTVVADSGTTLGGNVVTITGTNFQDGAVVYFDGFPGATTFNDSTSLTVITPAHWAGIAKVMVKNPDTRFSKDAVTFTYVPPAALINLSVSSTGDDVTLTWTDENNKGSYEVFWALDPTFDNWVEPAASGVVTPRWDHVGAMADNQVYFYKVE